MYQYIPVYTSIYYGTGFQMGYISVSTSTPFNNVCHPLGAAAAATTTTTTTTTTTQEKAPPTTPPTMAATATATARTQRPTTAEARKKVNCLLAR